MSVAMTEEHPSTLRLADVFSSREGCILAPTPLVPLRVTAYCAPLLSGQKDSRLP